jgi:hypothetical protein
VLATVITKREQFHSNIIGQSVTLGREEVRNRIAQTRIISWPTASRTPPLRTSRRSWPSARP